GPWPWASRRARDSGSPCPMAAKFSGSTASRAPPSAACSSSRRAARRLVGTSAPLTIWMAARIMASFLRFSGGDAWRGQRTTDRIFDGGKAQHLTAEQLVHQVERAAYHRRPGNQRGQAQVIGQRQSDQHPHIHLLLHQV